MRIRQLEKFRKRRPGGAYFDDLPWEVQRQAGMWLHKFCKDWGHDLPDWRFAILVARARWLAVNPPTSEWGRKMLAKRGGYAVQRRYRYEGRHPTEAATDARKWKRISPARIMHLPL